MAKKKIATAKIVYLNGWSINPKELNSIIDDMTEDMLILSVGKFHPNSQWMTDKLYSALEDNRCGALGLRSAAEEEVIILDNLKAPYGSILALSAKALRFNRFQEEYNTLKYGGADLCNRMNLDGMKCMILRLPDVSFTDIPKEIENEKEAINYSTTWKK